MNQPSNSPNLYARDATAKDLTALTKLKAPLALHRDRLRDAQVATFRYLVLLQADTIIGFGCLVFVRPASWSDAHDTSRLPQIVDVMISEPLRSRGYGSYLIGSLEKLAAQHGCAEIFIAVENP